MANLNITGQNFFSFFLSFSSSLIASLNVSTFHADQRKEKFLVTITVLFKVKYCYRWEQKAYCCRTVILQCTSGAHCLQPDWQWRLHASDAISKKICQHKEIMVSVQDGQMQKSTIWRFVSKLGFISTDSPRLLEVRTFVFLHFTQTCCNSVIVDFYIVSIFFIFRSVTQCITHDLTSLLSLTKQPHIIQTQIKQNETKQKVEKQYCKKLSTFVLTILNLTFYY